jgi:protein involved in polysaccharide export with SLBB domain
MRLVSHSITRANVASSALPPRPLAPKSLRGRSIYFFGSLVLSLPCLAAKPQFADFPSLFFPATNIIQASLAADSTNAASPGGTNAATPLPTAMDALDQKYRLAIGDRLSFRIVEDDEPPKQLQVTDSGDLELPYLGRYPVVGKTCKELAQALKIELQKEYYYQATVIVAVDFMTKSRGKIYLVGPVRAPGQQDVPSDEKLTLSKAIMKAGGFTDFADKRNVKVTRRAGTGGKEQTFTINVEEVLEKGKVDSDMPLQPEDLIIIPERLIRF